MTLVSKVNVNYVCLFDLITLPPSQHFFSHVEKGLPGLNLAEDNQLCLTSFVWLFAQTPRYFMEDAHI